MPNKKPAHINVVKNGPYIVENLKKYNQATALCRCGESKNKPYCDGAHVQIGFNDTKERKETYPTREFKGKELTVVDNIGICSHDGHCVRCSPSVFYTWENGLRISHPDNETKEKAIKTIRQCPSGSLTYKLDDKIYDQYFDKEDIIVTKNGPLQIRGGIEISEPHNQELISKEHYTLCRCGGSKNKPFCDGTHKKIKFDDSQ